MKIYFGRNVAAEGKPVVPKRGEFNVSADLYYLIDEHFHSLLTILSNTYHHCIDYYGTPKADKLDTYLKAKPGTVDLPSHYFWLDKEDDAAVIKYIPAGKVAETVLSNREDTWGSGVVQSMKPGKFFSFLLTDKAIEALGITPTAIEKFTNQVKSAVLDDVILREVKGDEIGDWFDSATHATPGKGSLASSCMNWRGNRGSGSRSPKTFDFYAGCPDCTLLIAVNEDNKLLGRGIVWHNVQLLTRPNGKWEQQMVSFLSTIYVAKEKVTAAMINYAKERGWYMRNQYSSYTLRLAAEPNTDIGTFYARWRSGQEKYISPYCDGVSQSTHDPHFMFLTSGDVYNGYSSMLTALKNIEGGGEYPLPIITLVKQPEQPAQVAQVAQLNPEMQRREWAPVPRVERREQPRDERGRFVRVERVVEAPV